VKPRLITYQLLYDATASNSYMGDEERGVEVADIRKVISNGDEISRFGERSTEICWGLLIGELSIMGNLRGTSKTISGDWDMKSTRFRNSGRGSSCLGWNASGRSCRIAN